jgi:hypothetical protein
MSFKFDNTKTLDYNVREYLTDVRQMNPTNYRVRKFKLYTDLNNAMASKTPLWAKRNRDGSLIDLPVAVFNTIIGDMKKVGIIKTAHDSQEVFLSDDAWNDFLSTVHQNRIVGPPGLAIKMDLVRLIDKGVFSSVAEITTKLIECGLVSRDPNASSGISGDPLRVGEWVSTQEAEFDKKNASTEGGK